ncbi:phage portal protein [Alkalihalobacterium alkalinitrilicum]|uniref:phage portal protein n=1 Tax=Alkalihalobacterium alkalinitrilicum TaxID=427920 RepID=UPI00099538F9|nr:phage portal protein [Alkalihalobacterium alkalinitrilicum]
MGFKDWWYGFLFKDTTLVKLSDDFFKLKANVFYKHLAVETCIDFIANTLTRCEFQTFEKGKETRGQNYYLLNVQPNQNQNASEFMHSLVNHLIKNNECLVIMQDKQLYVADTFNKKEFTLRENFYDEVTVRDLKFNKTFKESEVLYFKLNDRNIMSVIDGLWLDYGKLLASAINYYKRKNNKRILVKGDFLRAQDQATQEAIDEMFESQLKNWFDPDKEGSAFQIQDGYSFEDLSDGSTGKAQNSTSRDVSDLVNDMINYVSMAFHIPRGLIKGDVADIDKQIDSFIMFCIKPIAKLIADEFNRKMYTKEEYLKRTYLKVETNELKMVDITQFANAADKLFAIGGLSINDILKKLGQEPIDEEWANKRYVTKNYQEADSLKGGES